MIEEMLDWLFGGDIDPTDIPDEPIDPGVPKIGSDIDPADVPDEPIDPGVPKIGSDIDPTDVPDEPGHGPHLGIAPEDGYNTNGNVSFNAHSCWETEPCKKSWAKKTTMDSVIHGV